MGHGGKSKNGKRHCMAYGGSTMSIIKILFVYKKYTKKGLEYNENDLRNITQTIIIVARGVDREIWYRLRPRKQGNAEKEKGEENGQSPKSSCYK